MSAALPKSFQFKLLSSCLSIVPFDVSNGKFSIIITVNIIVLLVEIIMEVIFREDIFAFVEQPVLMFLDCVAIIGPILVHVLMISESLIKMKSDVIIWRKINALDNKFGGNTVSLQKLFQRDFFLMTAIPPIFNIGVILATYRTQRHWALGIICNQMSGVAYHWGILMFIYYTRYISDKLSSMAQEIEHLNDLTKAYKFSCNVAVDRIYQMKHLLNLVWDMHDFVNTRYEIFLVFYIFLSLCGLTTSMYFLGVRLIARNFSYAFESTLCLVSYIYTNVHISAVSSDFMFKVQKLFDALQSLSDQNWNCPEVISAVKSFKYQLFSANMKTDIRGHLKVNYSNIVLGILFIITTNIFIFLFLN